jgi:prepilin-type N-terminal cleavage/methylation domain-containing protein
MATLPQPDLILMKLRKKGPESGFTLIETIITIVIVAVVVTMIMVYFGKGIIHSADPIARLQSEANLAQVMENITLQYSQYPHWRPNTSYGPNSVVLPPDRNGYHSGFRYKTTAGGMSGSVELVWPSPPFSSGYTVSEATGGGNVTWTVDTTTCATDLNGTCPNTAGYCTCPSGLQSLIGAERAAVNNTFGNYKVVQNHFVEFDSGIETGPTAAANALGQVLKVTIAPPANAAGSQTISALFTLR